MLRSICSKVEGFSFGILVFYSVLTTVIIYYEAKKVESLEEQLEKN